MSIGFIPPIPAIAIHNGSSPATPTTPLDIATQFFAEGIVEVRATTEESQTVVRAMFGDVDVLTTKPSVGNYSLEGWVIELATLGDTALASLTYSYTLYGSGVVYTVVDPSPSSVIALPTDSTSVFNLTALTSTGYSFNLTAGFNVITYATRVRPPVPNDPVQPGDITAGMAYSLVASNTRPLRGSENATLSNGQVRLFPLLKASTPIEVVYEYELRPSLT